MVAVGNQYRTHYHSGIRVKPVLPTTSRSLHASRVGGKHCVKDKAAAFREKCSRIADLSHHKRTASDKRTDSLPRAGSSKVHEGSLNGTHDSF